jgi:hypothetical protein
VVCVRQAPADPASLERGVRQLLADKVCGTHVGLWLLIPEYLRQGTWDLLRGWSGQPEGRVETRLALQLVNEAALCAGSVRARRCLSQRGFELACGLPFVAADQPIHDLLDGHSVAQAAALQRALGMIRRSLGHFPGGTLAVDPHRMRSYSKRQMRRRKGMDAGPARKTSQTFFALDADTCQPICFTSGSSAVTASQATPALLDLCRSILQPAGRPLVLLDCEHYSADLFRHARNETPFDLLAPLPQTARLKARLAGIPPDAFTPRWAGFATATVPHRFTGDSEDFHLLVQRCGERPQEQWFKAFLSTRQGEEVQTLCHEFPKRWRVEEFFNANQSLGWKRAGTLNLNVRYGQMTMALLAQSALHALRTRLGEPWQNAEASCLARDLLGALDGDIRVHDDTILVTFYNAPNAERLRPHYEHLPAILESEKVDPRVPWLYNFKLDFRFA